MEDRREVLAVVVEILATQEGKFINKVEKPNKKVKDIRQTILKYKSKADRKC